PPPSAWPSLSGAFKSSFDPVRAGASPKNKPERTEIAEAKAKTRQSRWISAKRGSVSLFSVRMKPRPASARSRPSVPPSSDMKTLSVRKSVSKTSPAGTERQANGNFLVPACGTSKQEVGHVGASSYEQQSDGEKQNHERRTNASSKANLQGNRAERQARIVQPGIPFLNALGKGGQLAADVTVRFPCK